jgi:hypothetical protein
VAARIVWPIIAIGVLVVGGASPSPVLVGQRVAFNKISDGCPTLDQLDKLNSDNVSHDRGAYYLDFKAGGCIEAVPGDEGYNLEFNLVAKANRIRLIRDQQAYWFHTIGPDGDPRFNTR